jgi:acyl carrier protein
MVSNIPKITEIVAEVLERDAAEVGPDADLVKELGMDSVLAIDIATALEKHYKVQVPDDQMEALVSVRAIADVVDSLLAQARA